MGPHMKGKPGRLTRSTFLCIFNTRVAVLTVVEVEERFAWPCTGRVTKMPLHNLRTARTKKVESAE